ncbi:heme-dependent oxidative N-demethylase family protein [Peribacillus acanthi]|uniref:heme-dependent oxidative N-demethylase family protein n=1 Tax=Peribacillus acanthi TaxID=2171554 RepID=UPI001F0C866B|nr:DUF3445 domain-containing protein [Peribacillus acanthi]
MNSFPYPFKGDVYRYSNNSTLLKVPKSIDITDTYVDEIKLKRDLLTKYPKRCFQSQSHSIKGQWEILELIIDHLTTYYPTEFLIDKYGDDWVFRNKILDEKHHFTFGDVDTLPCEPLDFIGRHVQEDLLFMMQRDGDLFLDAGQLCFPANWSLAFNLGMNFKEIHHPIPGFKEESLDNRINNFLLRLEAGNPWGRKNWSLMAGSRLDTSLETFDQWGQDRKKVTKENAGDVVHLRVEDQKLFRLPGSNGILFTIHTHLISLDEFTTKREWLVQFYQILQELPEYITDYKGLSLFKKQVLDYLKERHQEIR